MNKLFVQILGFNFKKWYLYIFYKTKKDKNVFFTDGDSGGVRTRDFLDENQTSWTTRRRNREIIITFFGHSRKSLKRGYGLVMD